MFSDGNYWSGNSGNYTTSLLKNRSDIPSFIDFDATLNYDGNKKFSTTITINPLKDISGDNRLFVALVEKKTVKNFADEYLNYYGAATFYANFDTVFHHVMKKFMTSVSGQSVTLAENTPVTVNLEYEFKGEYRLPADATSPINNATENSVKGSHHGTFLPQVADETGWTTEEFLGYCARDKAGIGWDGWKTAELYTYQTEVVKE